MDVELQVIRGAREEREEALAAIAQCIKDRAVRLYQRVAVRLYQRAQSGAITTRAKKRQTGLRSSGPTAAGKARQR